MILPRSSMPFRYSSTATLTMLESLFAEFSWDCAAAGSRIAATTIRRPIFEPDFIPSESIWIAASGKRACDYLCRFRFNVAYAGSDGLSILAAVTTLSSQLGLRERRASARSGLESCDELRQPLRCEPAAGQPDRRHGSFYRIRRPLHLHERIHVRVLLESN